MKAISPPEEVKVCQTCGDVGFTNAFVYCVKCLEFVIHRYCLNVIPKSFTEPVIWYCESCKPTVQKKVTSPEFKSSSPEKNGSKKNIDTIWSEILSSDSNSDSSSNSSNMKEFDEWESRIAEQNQVIDRIFEDMLISYPDLILEDNYFTSRKRSRDGENCIQKQHKKKEKKERDIASLMEQNVSKLPNIESNIQDYYYRHGQPIIDPVWRGSFTVHGKDGDDLFEGLVGHLSNKACGKVCEEANLLPSLLHLEMQSKTLLWPKSFQHCEPSDDHIALYFFPGDPINERAFDELVLNMMDGSLAMKATVKNADLLIFTSATLPTLFRRFQGKYYLWGVFRGKRNDLRVSNNSDKC